MFKSFAATLLLSSQFAIAEAKRGGRAAERMANAKYACCMLEGNPADPNSVSGMFLFSQCDEDARIKVQGRVDLGYTEDAAESDTRALSITENSYDGLDCGLNGDIYNPFTADRGYESLRDMIFGQDGIGYYEHRDRLTTLFGDNSIIDRSVSMYEMEEQSGFIDACCTIESITSEQYFEARKQLDSDQSEETTDEGERRLQDDGTSDDSLESAESEQSVDSESEESVSSDERRLQDAGSSDSEDSVASEDSAESEASVESEDGADSDSSADERRLQDEMTSDDSESEQSQDDEASSMSEESVDSESEAEGSRRLRSKA